MPADRFKGPECRRRAVGSSSPVRFRTLLQDPKNLRSNLIDYLSKLSHTVADIFERFKFEGEVATLDEKDRLYLVV